MFNINIVLQNDILGYVRLDGKLQLRCKIYRVDEEDLRYRLRLKNGFKVYLSGRFLMRGLFYQNEE